MVLENVGDVIGWEKVTEFDWWVGESQRSVTDGGGMFGHLEEIDGCR